MGFELEEVFVFDSKSETRDRAVKAVESVSEHVSSCRGESMSSRC